VIGTIAVEDFRNLESWKHARFVVCAILSYAESLSHRAESRRFASEIDRLSVSVLDNIARAYEGRSSRSSLTKAVQSIDKLEAKLERATQDGVLTTSESTRLMRELRALKESLPIP